MVAYINFANLSESCGSADATSNSNANSIAETILMPVHEPSKETQHKKHEQNASLTVSEDSDDKSCNGTKSEATFNHINNKNFENGCLVNGLKNSDLNINGSVKDKSDEVNIGFLKDHKVNAKESCTENSQHQRETLLTNGVLKLACSPLHVHDKPKNSVILAPVIEKDFEYKHKLNNIEKNSISNIKDENEMHEIIEYGESTIESSSDFEHFNFDLNSELPPIAESIESNSTSSKSLENKGEQFFFTLSLLPIYFSFNFFFFKLCIPIFYLESSYLLLFWLFYNLVN